MIIHESLSFFFVNVSKKGNGKSALWRINTCKNKWYHREDFPVCWYKVSITDQNLLADCVCFALIS